MQKLDKNGCYTLFGVYEECKGDIDKELQELPKGVTKSKRINYRTFSKIIRSYFKHSFALLIDGRTFQMFNKFGSLDVVKTECIRYNPKTVHFYRENGELKRKEVRLDTNAGYWWFVFWNSPKYLRQYRFKINRKYKRMYMEKVEQGFDYVDLSLSKYGRNASLSYIHHIK